MVPTDIWALLGTVVTLAAGTVAALVRQLEKTTAALESLQSKMIDQAVPALERSTAAGLALGPILQQNAETLGKASKAGDDLRKATEEAFRLLAVLSDREQRRGQR